MCLDSSRKIEKVISMRKALVFIASACVTIGAATTSLAQGSASSGVAPAAASRGAASGTKSTSAERKAARKEARAKKNADLKKLEQSGYQPGRDSLSYPQDVQNAQKKAAGENAASQ